MKKGRKIDEVLEEINRNGEQLTDSDVKKLVKKKLMKMKLCKENNKEFPMKALKKLISREVDLISKEVM